MNLHLPLHVYVGKKKFNLNLNEYRNAHYHVLAKAKKQFEQNLYPQLKGHSPISNPVNVDYIIYRKDRRGFDISNIGGVIDKFACDALVKGGILPDDNFKVVQSVNYRFGGIDHENPRCELHIREIHQ